MEPGAVRSSGSEEQCISGSVCVEPRAPLQWGGTGQGCVQGAPCSDSCRSRLKGDFNGELQLHPGTSPQLTRARLLSTRRDPETAAHDGLPQHLKAGICSRSKKYWLFNACGGTTMATSSFVIY